MSISAIITTPKDFMAAAASRLEPLPHTRPLLLIGHGSRDSQGRDNLLEFAATYQTLDPTRPVIPCFLELTEPTILDGVEQCVAKGFTEISVLPVLLFAARHNKFDVTSELDRARQRYPQVRFHYGRHFGITPEIINLWQHRLNQLDTPEFNPEGIPREETVLLFVGRGASDPDANGDVYKLARILWEGSGYQTLEICFIGITHPRLEEGFRRARLYRPRRIVVLPYFLFTGVLIKKIQSIALAEQTANPDIAVAALPEMGLHPQLLQVLRRRELETQLGQVTMNCEMCKFRLAAQSGQPDHSHHHHHHGHGHHADSGHHHHADPAADPYAEPSQYHERAWQVP